MAKRILVVEDEKHIRTLVRLNLEQAGFAVATAADGVQALEAVARELPDLVLLDWMMPELDGDATLRRLKAEPRTAGVPVVMLTARSHQGDVLAMWNAGVEAYLTKPFNPRELLDVVRRLLDDPENAEHGHAQPAVA